MRIREDVKVHLNGVIPEPFPCGQITLRGSALQPVLTATGLVNGKWRFSTPLQNRHPLTDHQKICHTWLCCRPLHLCHIWCTSTGANGWNITKLFIYFFLYAPFFGGTALYTELYTERLLMCACKPAVSIRGLFSKACSPSMGKA